MSEFKIYNGFGIVPTYTYEAAGLDFFIPNIKGTDKQDIILNAFSKSYKKSIDELAEILNLLSLYISAKMGFDAFNGNELNFLHLFLALDASEINYIDDLSEKVSAFVDDYLIFDDNGTPGLLLQTNDHVFFNSGIKVHLDKDTAGIFFNKSGKGIKGFDVRAQVVDEDYSGFVHLSLSFTKYSDTDGIMYCGDKITQMVIVPIIHKVPVEITEDEYDVLMAKSKRGGDGFGSSDVKH